MHMRYSLAFALLLMALLPRPGHAQSVPGQETILSKQDTAAMFAMDYAAWNANVDQAARMGLAKAVGNGSADRGLATAHDHGFMLVTPSYASAGTPNSIQVMVGYEEPASSSLSDDALRDIVEKAVLELAPEYLVTGEIERFDGGAGIFFLIVEAR